MDLQASNPCYSRVNCTLYLLWSTYYNKHQDNCSPAILEHTDPLTPLIFNINRTEMYTAFNENSLYRSRESTSTSLPFYPKGILPSSHKMHFLLYLPPFLHSLCQYVKFLLLWPSHLVHISQSVLKLASSILSSLSSVTPPLYFLSIENQTTFF